MQIRTAGYEDADAIAEIEKNVSSPWSEEIITEELKHQAARVLVAVSERGACVVGWCSMRCIPPEAELLKITVAPGFRKKGVGSRLLEESCKQAREKGCSDFFLEVRAENGPARNFYTHHGFHELGRRKKYYRRPEDDAVIYKKSIPSE